MEYIVLNNGAKCPVVGIGTFMLSPADGGKSKADNADMAEKTPPDDDRLDQV